jgi:MFS family permease
VLLFIVRDQWFVFDDWDFLAARTITGGEHGFFEPHNEHWSTIPILIYGAIFSLAGLKIYLPYMAVLLVLHVGVVHALWRVMRRCGVDQWIAVAAAAVFLVFGPGADNILWAFQIGFVGSFLAGVTQLLLLDRAGPPGRRDVAAVGIGTGGLLFSGISVPMVATAGGFALFRRGWRVVLPVIGLPAAVYVLWLATAGADGLSAHPAPTPASLARLPEFVWLGLASTFHAAAGSAPAAVALAVGLTVLVVLRLRRGFPIPMLAIAMAAGTVVLLVVVGVGRTGVGIETAATSRYVYLVGGLLLPLVAVALTELAERSSVGGYAAVALLGVAVAGSFLTLQHRAERQAAGEAEQRRAIFAARELQASGAVLVATAVAAELQLSDIERLESQGALPERPPLSDRDRLNAAVIVQVSMSPRARVPVADGSVRVELLRGAGVEERNGCATLRPGPRGASFLLSYTGPSSLTLRSPTLPVRLEVVLRRVGEQREASVVRPLDLLPAVTRYLNLAAPGVLAEVRVPEVGQLEVCHAGAWPTPVPVA